VSPATTLRLDRIRVSEAMHSGVVTCSADASLASVADTMATNHIHAVAVAVTESHGGDAAQWAIVSDRDVVAAAVAGDINRLTAGDIASGEVLTVSDGERLDRAMQRMAEHQAGHLVVVAAASGRPVGILSTLDVASVLATR
jgi:CBS domain-containing protein